MSRAASDISSLYFLATDTASAASAAAAAAAAALTAMVCCAKIQST